MYTKGTVIIQNATTLRQRGRLCAVQLHLGEDLTCTSYKHKSTREQLARVLPAKIIVHAFQASSHSVLLKVYVQRTARGIEA